MALWNKREHWRNRAEEARAIAEGMKNPHARTTLEAIAREYEELVDLADRAHTDTKPRYYYRERG